MARLNDTAALTSAPSRGGESHHISTRKIDNGFLVERSTCTDTGEYKSSTEFHREAPRVAISTSRARSPNGEPSGRKSDVGSESLRDASEYLGKK